MPTLIENIQNLFGFEIKNPEREKKEKTLKTFAPPENEDGALITAYSGTHTSYIDFTSKDMSATEVGLINKYREMAVNAEAEIAIDDIINEMVVFDEDGGPVELIMDNVDGLSKNIKNQIIAEFDEILELMRFKERGYDIVRRWYVDGRSYHHIMIDEKNTKKGIQDLRYIDPRKIRKVKERKSEGGSASIDPFTQEFDEYYLYTDKGLDKEKTGLKISRDAIAFIHSGILNFTDGIILSHLHKAIKPFNQLRMIEDAKVIYSLARAPERRIFYIDVAGLPPKSAEKYVQNIVQRMKNQMSYDVNTGEVINERNYMTMLEDFFLPQRDGGGTNVETLPGGQGLGEMEEVDYFRRKLYRALNVPISRLESDAGFNLGRASEISRDEVKFTKFVKRLRNQFSDLFSQLLEKQIVLKGIMTLSEWQAIESQIQYDWQVDNFFSELKEGEILEGRLATMSNAMEAVEHGFLSKKWVRKNVLQQSDEDIKDIDKEIKKEQEEEGVDNEFGDTNFVGRNDFNKAGGSEPSKPNGKDKDKDKDTSTLRPSAPARPSQTQLQQSEGVSLFDDLADSLHSTKKTRDLTEYKKEVTGETSEETEQLITVMNNLIKSL